LDRNGLSVSTETACRFDRNRLSETPKFAIMPDLKAIYRAETAAAALGRLDAVEPK
jgi:hypothetical protein